MLSDRHCRLLTAYVDGELTAHERQAVVRMVRESGEARAFLQQLQEDAEQIRQLPQVQLGQDLSDPILQKIARPILGPRAPTSSPGAGVPIWFGLATAAAVLSAVGLGSYFYFAATKHAQLPEMAVVPRDPIQPPGVIADKRAGEEGQGRNPGKLPDRAPNRVAPKGTEEPEPLPQSTPTPQRDSLAYPASTRDSRRDQPLEFDIHPPLSIMRADYSKEARWLELLVELRKRPTHHLDLTSRDAVAAVDRLGGALKAHGVQLLVDDEAKDHLKPLFRNGKEPVEYIVYTENVTPDEALAVLKQLAAEDKKAEEKRRGSGPIAGISALTMSDNDRGALIRLIGIDPNQPVPKRPRAAADGIDIREPISTQTGDQVARSLKGQGPPRPEPGQPILKSSDRLAILVANKRNGTRQDSRQVQRFIRQRSEPRPGTTRLLLMLRSTKS
jgi:hypothetical protein